MGTSDRSKQRSGAKSRYHARKQPSRSGAFDRLCERVRAALAKRWDQEPDAVIVVGVFSCEGGYIARYHARCDVESGLCDERGRFTTSVVDAVRDALLGVEQGGTVQGMRDSVASARAGVSELRSLAGDVMELVGGLLPPRGGRS